MSRSGIQRRYLLALGALLGATALTAKLAVLALKEPDTKGVPRTAAPTPAAVAVVLSPVPEQEADSAQPGFLRRYEYDHIVVHTNLKFETDRVKRVAKRTCTEVAALTGLPIPSRKLPVYLCDQPEQILALEKRYDLGNIAVRGGIYFHKGPVAIIQERPLSFAASERIVSHEMVHWIIETVVRKCPSLINEGIAVLISEQVFVRTIIDDFRDADRRDRTPIVTLSPRSRAARLRRYLDGGKRFSLGELLPLTPRRFKKLQEDGRLFYDLSWCLAKTIEDHGKELGLTIRSLFKRLRAGEDPRTIILSNAIETAWMETVAAVAKPATR